MVVNKVFLIYTSVKAQRIVYVHNILPHKHTLLCINSIWNSATKALKGLSGKIIMDCRCCHWLGLRNNAKFSFIPLTKEITGSNK